MNLAVSFKKPRTKTCLSLLVSLVVLVIGSCALASNVGRIIGKVQIEATGEPLAFANVVLLGTQYGAMTTGDGEYIIVGVPPGVYSLRATFMGYTTVTRTDVEVAANQTARVNFELKETVVGETEEIVVTSTRPMVEVDVASTVRTLGSEELKVLPVGETLQDVLAIQAGIVGSKDEIHIRGGRTDEVVYIVDGVKMKDALSGSSTGEHLSARSVAEMSVITGGFSAKYGQALSGVIDVKVREGSSDYHGYFAYSTDRALIFDYFNYDYVDFQVGGPEPLSSFLLPKIGVELPGKITFFMDVSGEVSDTYLPDIGDLKETEPGNPRLISSYKDSFFGREFTYGSFFSPRSDNNWRGLGKLVWKLGPKHKIGFSMTKWIGINQGFAEHDIGDVAKNVTNYPWSWSKRLDHYYTITDDRNSFSASWKHTISKSTYHNLRLSRYFSGSHRDVAGKLWSEYVQPDDTTLPDSLNSVYALCRSFFKDSCSHVGSLYPKRHPLFGHHGRDRCFRNDL
ncbi:MAG: carboxypeptidase regulatory-like domain-containing protein, partial [Candidatus Eiseniibacteriota bacterium]